MPTTSAVWAEAVRTASDCSVLWRIVVGVGADEAEPSRFDVAERLCGGRPRWPPTMIRLSCVTVPNPPLQIGRSSAARAE